MYTYNYLFYVCLCACVCTRVCIYRYFMHTHINTHIKTHIPTHLNVYTWNTHANTQAKEPSFAHSCFDLFVSPRSGIRVHKKTPELCFSIPHSRRHGSPVEARGTCCSLPVPRADSEAPLCSFLFQVKVLSVRDAPLFVVYFQAPTLFIFGLRVLEYSPFV